MEDNKRHFDIRTFGQAIKKAGSFYALGLVVLFNYYSFEMFNPAMFTATLTVNSWIISLFL